VTIVRHSFRFFYRKQSFACTGSSLYYHPLVVLEVIQSLVLFFCQPQNISLHDANPGPESRSVIEVASKNIDYLIPVLRGQGYRPLSVHLRYTIFPI
jgi:hypothetical protein